jgi:CDP-diacylglycerol--glycerol-3-phosphate 3-phosphatidyltransferase
MDARILPDMTLADQLTVGRVLAVPVVVLLFAWDFPDHAYWATALFGAAALTDQIDGWLARRAGQTTDLGRILDPVADKILVLAALIVLVPVLPGWMVAAIVARELLVSGLRLAAIERGVVVSARDIAKLKTWSQAVAVGLGGLALGGAIDRDVAWWCLLVALVLTLVSGLDYARVAPALLRGRQPA